MKIFFFHWNYSRRYISEVLVIEEFKQNFRIIFEELQLIYCESLVFQCCLILKKTKCRTHDTLYRFVLLLWTWCFRIIKHSNKLIPQKSKSLFFSKSIYSTQVQTKVIPWKYSGTELSKILFSYAIDFWITLSAKSWKLKI